MSLNNEQMLPARVRSMRQMAEVLAAEDIILAELERVIDECYVRAADLHEELVNEEWLEERIRKITGGIVEVTALKDTLQVDVAVNKGDLSGTDSTAVIQFLEKWLPAHLAYGVTCEKLLGTVNRYAAIWQDDEAITVKQIEV